MTTTQDIPTATAPHNVSGNTHVAIAGDDETRTPCGDLLPDALVDAHVAACPGCLVELDRWDAAVS